MWMLLTYMESHVAFWKPGTFKAGKLKTYLNHFLADPGEDGTHWPWFLNLINGINNHIYISQLLY